MAVTGLGHTGFWVDDLEKMRDFYTRVLGLTVTDEDEGLGIVFLSSRPQEEHHEFVLQRGRTAPAGSKLTHQVSWRVDSLESIIEFHHRFPGRGHRGAAGGHPRQRDRDLLLRSRGQPQRGLPADRA